MTPPLGRTRAALEECRQHLEDAEAFGTRIESFLTGHVVIMLCAEVEETVRDIIHDYVQRNSHEDVAYLVGRIGANIVRSAEYAEIKQVVGYLGKDYQKRYQELVHDAIGDSGIARVANAVTDRNSLTHGTPPNVSFNDAVEAYKAAEKIVEAVEEAVNGN